MIIYKPYTGGGGPSEDLIANNNQALCQYLNMEYKIHATIELASKYDIPGSEEDDFQVVVFKEKGKLYTISYDRWGYVCDQSDGDVDQMSFTNVCAWILKNL